MCRMHERCLHDAEARDGSARGRLGQRKARPDEGRLGQMKARPEEGSVNIGDWHCMTVDQFTTMRMQL